MSRRKRKCDDCPTVKQLRAEFAAFKAQATAEIGDLRTQLQKASKTSATSSKPPSSDIVKPPRERRMRGKRKKGGQPGHPMHVRPPFTPEEIDVTVPHPLSCCPHCRGKLRAAADVMPKTIQQVDLAEQTTEVTEHVGLAYRCNSCGCVVQAPIPEAVEKAGLIGPRLTAVIAHMKAVSHASLSSVRRYLHDVHGLTISRGQLAKILQKISNALKMPYEEIYAALRQQPRLNIDETGHKENGDHLWTWCFRAEQLILFKIAESRGSVVLLDVLGPDFQGIIGCDYFSAYRKYLGETNLVVQFCLAHLIRDVRFLTESADKITANYGQRLLDAIGRLFDVYHQRESLPEPLFLRRMDRSRKEVLSIGRRAPQSSEAQNMANRFRQYGREYFTFITTPGIDPTNNLAEQAIRFCVIDRHVTQGTRSPRGREWCERIWTAAATCKLQNRSLYDFLLEAINAHFENRAPPSLLPSSSTQSIAASA